MNTLWATFLFVFILALPLGIASIYDGTGPGLISLYSGSSNSGSVVELNGKLFTLTATSTKASLVSNDLSLTTNKDDCIVKSGYGFCIDGIEVSNETSVRKVTFRVYLAMPFFALNSTYEEDFNGTFFPDESKDITFSFQNVGPAPAETISLQIPFPSSMEVVSVSSPCKRSANTVTYAGSMDPQKMITCKYTVKFLSAISYYGSAKATAMWEEISYNQSLPSTNFTGTSILQIEFYFNATTPLPGESVTFNITLRNPSSQDVHISSLELAVPSTFKFTTIPSSFKRLDAKTLTLEKTTLEDGKNLSFSFKFSPLISDTQFVELSGAYTSGNQQGTFSEKSSQISTASAKPPLLTSDLSSELGAGQEVLFSLWGENENVFLAYENLSVETITNLTFISGTSFQSLAPLAKKKLLALAFKAPQVNERTTYTLNFSVHYAMQGVQKEISLIKSVVVIPQGNITMSHTFGETSFHSGNWTKLQIVLKNNRKEAVTNARVEVSSSLFKFIGKTLHKLDIGVDETKTLDSIYIQGPLSNVELKDNITSHLSFEASGSSYGSSYTTEVTLLPSIVYNASSPEYKLKVTRTFQPTPDSRGESYWVTYSLENQDAEDFQSVFIELPKQEEWDVIGEPSFSVDLLPAGATLILQQVAEVRPKYAGNVRLLEDRVSFLRKNGLMENITANTTFTITDQIAEKVLILQRRISVEHSRADILLTVKNTGTESLQFELRDGSFSVDDTLSPGETNYTFSETLAPGAYVRSPAQAYYDEFIAFSNFTSFIIEEIPVESIVEEISASENNSSIANSSTLDEIPLSESEIIEEDTPEAIQPIAQEDSRNIITRFFDWIRGWFR